MVADLNVSQCIRPIYNVYISYFLSGSASHPTRFAFDSMAKSCYTIHCVPLHCFYTGWHAGHLSQYIGNTPSFPWAYRASWHFCRTYDTISTSFMSCKRYYCLTQINLKLAYSDVLIICVKTSAPSFSSFFSSCNIFVIYSTPSTLFNVIISDGIVLVFML